MRATMEQAKRAWYNVAACVVMACVGKLAIAAPIDATAHDGAMVDAVSKAQEQPGTAFVGAMDTAKVRGLVLEHKYEQAAQLLTESKVSDARLMLELGRMLLHQTRYEQAREVLEREEVAVLKEGQYLGKLARDCERSMAGAVTAKPDDGSVVVRMQDDRDAVLVPYVMQVVRGVRDLSKQRFGVDLPIPIRIELVRDHYSLSMMTGLAQQAARTTGTVAIANLGRVTMVTPRAMKGGYAWMDALAHELIHVAVTVATRDRAPLWLQEAIAKGYETRWRRATVYDKPLEAHQLAAYGFRIGMSREFDQLGTSLALLPSPLDAAVVYAQVESFLKYVERERGPEMLAKLLKVVRNSRLNEMDSTSWGLGILTDMYLEDWYKQWKSWVIAEYASSTPPWMLREEQWLLHQESLTRKAGARGRAGGWGRKVATGRRALRLGELLLDRQHARQVVGLLTKQRWSMASDEELARYLRARGHYVQGDAGRAWEQLEEREKWMTPSAVAFALKGRLMQDREAAMHWLRWGVCTSDSGARECDGERRACVDPQRVLAHRCDAQVFEQDSTMPTAAEYFAMAVALDPWHPASACEFLSAPQAPTNRDKRALCEAARRHALGAAPR